MKELSMEEIQLVAGGLSFPTFAEYASTVGGAVLFATLSKSPFLDVVFGVASATQQVGGSAKQAAQAAAATYGALDVLLVASSAVVGAVVGHGLFSAAHVLHKVDERTA